MMTLQTVRGLSNTAVEKMMQRRGLLLWDAEETAGGILKETFLRTHAGVTVEEVQVIFDWNFKAAALRHWEASEDDVF